MEVIIVIIGIALVAAMIFGALAAKKRQQRLAAWADSHGLRFEPSRSGGVDDAFPEFRCLHEGADRYAENRMFGRWAGQELLAFDYHYETESTDSKGHRTTTDHHFSAVILKASIPLKPLVIRPESFLDKVKEFFGFDDIDFESAEFSRRFYVKSPDRRWAYDVIHPRTMELLLASAQFQIEFSRRHVMAHRSALFDVADFQAAAEVICGVLGGLPPYLLEQQKAAEPT